MPSSSASEIGGTRRPCSRRSPTKSFGSCGGGTAASPSVSAPTSTAIPSHLRAALSPPVPPALAVGVNGVTALAPVNALKGLEFGPNGTVFRSSSARCSRAAAPIVRRPNSAPIVSITWMRCPITTRPCSDNNGVPAIAYADLRLSYNWSRRCQSVRRGRQCVRHTRRQTSPAPWVSTPPTRTLISRSMTVWAASSVSACALTIKSEAEGSRRGCKLRDCRGISRRPAMSPQGLGGWGTRVRT